MAAELLLIPLILLILALVALIIFLTVFWIIMLVDCAKRDFKKDSDKIVWILILIFLSWLGAIIYHFVIKKSKKK